MQENIICDHKTLNTLFENIICDHMEMDIIYLIIIFLIVICRVFITSILERNLTTLFWFSLFLYFIDN